MKTTLTLLLAGKSLNGLSRYQRELDSQTNSNIILDLENGISRMFGEQLPDLLFINYTRDDLFGLNLLRKIRNAHPSMLVVVAVDPSHIKIGRHALHRGALAYIIKGEHELQQVKTVVNLALAKLRKTAVEPRRQRNPFRFALLSWRWLLQLS